MWFFPLLLLFIGAALSSSRKWKINKLPGVSFCLLPLSWAAAALSSLSHQTISNQRYSGWLALLIMHDIKWHQTPVAAAGTNNTSDSSNRGILGLTLWSCVCLHFHGHLYKTIRSICYRCASYVLSVSFHYWQHVGHMRPPTVPCDNPTGEALLRKT